jgi:hypothetical protein
MAASFNMYSLWQEGPKGLTECSQVSITTSYCTLFMMAASTNMYSLWQKGPKGQTDCSQVHQINPHLPSRNKVDNNCKKYTQVIYFSYDWSAIPLHTKKWLFKQYKPSKILLNIYYILRTSRLPLEHHGIRMLFNYCAWCIFKKCPLNFNPNPHCFIAITKATACGWKEPLLPHPLQGPVRGRGKVGAIALRPWRFA